MKEAAPMSVQFLFNSNGDWIAFRIDKYVYNTDGKWIGWLPWDDGDVVTVRGEYLGTITEKNRFFYYTGKPNRGYPGTPAYPGYPGVPRYPGFAGLSPLPPTAREVTIPAGE
jgi:hypothetical protein